VYAEQFKPIQRTFCVTLTIWPAVPAKLPRFGQIRPPTPAGVEAGVVSWRLQTIWKVMEKVPSKLTLNIEEPPRRLVKGKMAPGFPMSNQVIAVESAVRLPIDPRSTRCFALMSMTVAVAI
jgi:hypothetical protein